MWFFRRQLHCEHQILIDGLNGIIKDLRAENKELHARLTEMHLQGISEFNRAKEYRRAAGEVNLALHKKGESTIDEALDEVIRKEQEAADQPAPLEFRGRHSEVAES